MIRINLLPVKRSKKRDASVRELVIGGAVVGVVVVGLFIWYTVMAARISSTDERVQKLKNDIATLDQKILKVNEFKKKKRDLENKLAVIDDLKAKKVGPVKLLDELASNIPRKLWLTSFEERGGTMLAEGAASDNDEISDFLAYLTKRSHFFSKVSLIFSEQIPATATDPITTVKFKVTGQAQYGTLPAGADKPAEPAKGK